MKAPQFSNIQSWPWAVGTLESPQPAPKRARVRRRPDVGGYFTFTLAIALSSGTLLVGDMVRARVPLEECLRFLAQHPMALILGCFFALLLGLLAVGDV